MERLHWIIIEPVKALANLFFAIFQKFRETKLYMKILLTVRHYPSVFDSYLYFINKYGMVLPINGRLMEKLPFVSCLLCLNPYSKQNMERFLLKHYTDHNIEEKRRKTSFKSMFWDKPGWTSSDCQTSNVPMAITILIKLVRASYVPNTHIDHFECLKFSFAWYPEYFKKCGKLGLNEDTPIDEEISPDFHDYYREVVNLCFSPLKSMDCNDRFTYSMEEVLMALLYGRPPKYDGPQTNKPPFKFSDDDYKAIDAYLAKRFFLERDFYGTVEIGPDLEFIKDSETGQKKSTPRGKKKGY